MGIGTFARKTCVICVFAFFLLSVSTGSTFCVEHGLMLALRSQILEYLREAFYRHALEYSTCNRFVQKKRGKETFFLRKRPTITDRFEGLTDYGWWGNVFDTTSGSPRS